MTDISINHIHISKLPRYNSITHETEYYYSCEISFDNSGSFNFELTELNEYVTNEIYKVVYPYLIKSLESLPNGLKN